jgi:hypothetical protein
MAYKGKSVVSPQLVDTFHIRVFHRDDIPHAFIDFFRRDRAGAGTLIIRLRTK